MTEYPVLNVEKHFTPYLFSSCLFAHRVLPYAAPTLCVLARISYLKSRDLSQSLMVIEDFLSQDRKYGTAYPHLYEMPIS